MCPLLQFIVIFLSFLYSKHRFHTTLRIFSSDKWFYPLNNVAKHLSLALVFHDKFHVPISPLYFFVLQQSYLNFSPCWSLAKIDSWFPWKFLVPALLKHKNTTKIIVGVNEFFEEESFLRNSLTALFRLKIFTKIFTRMFVNGFQCSKHCW